MEEFDSLPIILNEFRDGCESQWIGMSLLRCDKVTFEVYGGARIVVSGECVLLKNSEPEVSWCLKIV